VPAARRFILRMVARFERAAAEFTRSPQSR
jgi:hypothetical protein